MPKTLLIEPDPFFAEDLTEIVRANFEKACITVLDTMPTLGDIALSTGWDLLIVNRGVYTMASDAERRVLDGMPAFKVLLGSEFAGDAAPGWHDIALPFTNCTVGRVLRGWQRPCPGNAI